MLALGTRDRVELGAPLEGLPCAWCDHESLRLVARHAYFRIGPVPVVPYSRQLGAICHVCDAVEEQLPAEVVASLEAAEAGTDLRAPHQLFAGLVLVAGLLLGSLFAPAPQTAAHTDGIDLARAQVVASYDAHLALR